MKNTGKQFETLTHKVFTLLSRNDRYTTVEHDVVLESPDGNRQFDVIIRAQVGSLDLLTVIECRDHNKNLNVTHVDGLHSKQLDVNANKAVLVARKGFSNAARRKASRKGITLCTVAELDGLKDIGLQVPVAVWEVTRFDLMPEWILDLRGKSDVAFLQSRLNYINDRSLVEEFRLAVQSGEIVPDPNPGLREWRPKFVGDSAFVRDFLNVPVEIKEFKVRFSTESRYFFGYMSDLESAVGIMNLTQGDSKLFFDSDELMNYEEILQEYESIEDLPKVDSIKINAVSLVQVSLSGNPVLNTTMIE